MEQVLKTLTLYDITAYLLPGLVVVWSIMQAWAFAQRESTASWSWKLIVVAYLVGQLLQVAMSDERDWRNRVLKAPHLRELDEVFPDKIGEHGSVQLKFRQDLIAAINQAFNAPSSSERFRLCEAYVQTRKLDSFIEIMHARYGFFRGLLLGFIISAAAFAIAALFRIRSWRGPYQREWMTTLLLAVVCSGGAYLSALRTNDFEGYYSAAMYRTFYVDYVWNQKHPAPAGTNPSE
jgi:hypothetical protein